MNYVTLRRPARNLFRLHGEMGQMFNDLFASPNEPTDETEYRWSPSVDIAETDSGFEVRAELPGVKQEDVNVSVRDNVLTLRGEKRQEETEEGKNYRRVERHYGSFQRAFHTPTERQCRGHHRGLPRWSLDAQRAEGGRSTAEGNPNRGECLASRTEEGESHQALAFFSCSRRALPVSMGAVSGQGCPSYQAEIGIYAESLSFKTPI